MTTAREQAREAAWSADDAWQDTNKHESIIIVHADAASDVWEALLREAVEHLRVWGSEDLRDSPMMERFDEALGQARPT